MKEHKINYNKAKQSDGGIKIHPTTATDYRKLVRLLEEKSFPFHTYQLPQDKQLHVVIRGIPLDATIEELESELKEKGFHPTKVIRMKMDKERRPITLILVLLPKQENAIYNMTNILGLSIKIESLRNKTTTNQCYNCQQFGHGQANCRAPPKCLKCANDHHTSTCTKENTTPAKCANCAGNHPANFSLCPKNPEHLKKNKENRPTKFTAATYAQITKTSPSCPTTPDYPKTPDFTKAITSIQAFAQQFSLLSTQLSKAIAPFMNLPQCQNPRND